MLSRKCCGDKILSKSVNYVIYLLSRDLNGQKAVKTVFAIVDEQHILLSDTICGHNGLEGQFESEYSNAIVHAFQKFKAPFSGKIVHIFPEQSAVI